MKLSELAEELLYNDMDSVINWCKKNKILVLHMGKARYVPRVLVELHKEKQFKDYIYKHYDNPDQIMEAYFNNDRVGLAESMEAPIDKEVKKNYKVQVKKERSKSAQDLLNKLKQA